MAKDGKLGEKPPQVDAGKSYLVKGSTLLALAKRGQILAGPGVRITEKTEGWMIEFDAQEIGHPFKIKSAMTSGGSPGIKFQLGTVEGLVPTISGTGIDATPSPVLPISGGSAPFFEMDVEPLVSNYGTESVPNWRIVGGNVTAVRIIASTAPTGTAATVDRTTGTTSDGVYYRRIGSQVDGIWSNAIRYSIDVSMCDDGSEGTGEGIMSVGLSG
jgi:hypothetical protein